MIGKLLCVHGDGTDEVFSIYEQNDVWARRQENRGVYHTRKTSCVQTLCMHQIKAFVTRAKRRVFIQIGQLRHVNTYGQNVVRVLRYATRVVRIQIGRSRYVNTCS